MDLNLKGVDENLVSRAKMAAYGREQTLKEWVIDAIQEKLSRKVEAAREAAGETAKEGPRGKAAKGGVTLGGGTSIRATHLGSGSLDSNRVSRGGDVPDSTVGANPTPATNSKIGQTPQHDSKNCRLYNCGMCRALGVKDKNRGLA